MHSPASVSALNDASGDGKALLGIGGSPKLSRSQVSVPSSVRAHMTEDGPLIIEHDDGDSETQEDSERGERDVPKGVLKNDRVVGEIGRGDDARLVALSDFQAF